MYLTLDPGSGERINMPLQWIRICDQMVMRSDMFLTFDTNLNDGTRQYWRRPHVLAKNKIASGLGASLVARIQHE